MEITEVRIKLTEDSDDRLQAFCSITFDNCFVVRDLKIIEGTNGPFVAMPSRKLTSHCSRCGCKNHLRAAHCNQCGCRLNPERAVREQDGRAKLYADIAHPINSHCREMIQQRVIAEYRHELELAKQPGYVSRYDEEFDEDFEAADLREDVASSAELRKARTRSQERPQIEPAVTEPRPPHTLATRRESANGPSADRPTAARRNGTFGAGVFEE